MRTRFGLLSARTFRTKELSFLANNIITFDEYADRVSVPHITRQIKIFERVDEIWVKYITSSIKESNRKKLGKGVWNKVVGKNKFQRNFVDFLVDPANKKELFTFLLCKFLTEDS